MVNSRTAPKRVLFLCTENSARSQIAEALLRHVASNRFEAFSAGEDPAPEVHPGALDVLRRKSVSSSGLVPKHVSSFAGQAFEYVITLCDAAMEQCPTFERAEIMRWTFADPTQAPDADARRKAFDDYFAGLSNRLRFLIIVDEKS
jgi:ArsR family transcriptional regulator